MCCVTASAGAARRVPLSARDVTPAWLAGALHAAGSLPAPVAEVWAHPLGEDRGFVGQTLRVAYRLAHRRRAETVVVKLPPASPHARAALAPLRYGEREAGFYRELAPVSPLPAPHCFYAACDPATGDTALVLQDLGDGEAGDDVAGCLPQHAAALVRGLAAFHGQHWGRPRWAFPWLPAFNEDQPDQYYGLLWRRLKRRHAAAIPPEFAAIAERLEGALPAFRARLAQPPLTVTHGDLRADNLVFFPDGPRVLDWQVVSWARGPLDLGYFLTQSFDPEERRWLEGGLLAAYHGMLADAGVAGYPLEECWADLRLGCLQNAATFVLAGGSLDFSGERAQRLLAVTLRRIVAAVADWRPFELLEA